MSVRDRQAGAGGASSMLVFNLRPGLSTVRCVFDRQRCVVEISRRRFLKSSDHEEVPIFEIEGFCIRREKSRSASRFTAFFNLRDGNRIELGRMSRSHAEAALIKVRQILGPLADGKAARCRADAEPQPRDDTQDLG